MNISSIGNRPDQAMLQLKQAGDRGKSGISQELKEKIAKIETGAAEPAQEGAVQDKGVVSLLQEGHFQGVADVRLRINFFEQLQLSVSQKAGEVLRTESRELLVGLEGQVQILGEELQVADQAEDLLAVFKEKAESLLGSSESGFDSSSVIGGLREAFAGFLASLQSVAPNIAEGNAESDGEVAGETALVGPEAVVVENTGPETEPEVQESDGSAATPEPVAFSPALQKLQEWIDTEIAALEKMVNDLQVPADPSEPRGNGAAYDRFLEIYKELEAGTDTSRTHGKA